MIFDITRPATFEQIPNWLQEQIKSNKNKIVPLVLIGNKSDLRNIKDINVTKAQAQAYADSLTSWMTQSGLKYSTANYIETSAKTGVNVDEAFKILLKNIISHQEELYQALLQELWQELFSSASHH